MQLNVLKNADELIMTLRWPDAKKNVLKREENYCNLTASFAFLDHKRINRKIISHVELLIHN